MTDVSDTTSLCSITSAASTTGANGTTNTPSAPSNETHEAATAPAPAPGVPSLRVPRVRPIPSVQRSKLLALVVAVLGLAALGWSASHYSAASRAQALAQSQHRAITAAATEIESLRRAAPSVAASAKPQPNISGHVTDALVEAGLAPALLTNLTPESDTAIERSARSPSDAPRYRRQSARLTLEPTTLPDLGRFLAAWRSSQPQWTVASITIAPVSAGTRGRTSTSPGASGSANAANADDADAHNLLSPHRPVRVNLVIECLYVDQPLAQNPSRAGLLNLVGQASGLSLPALHLHASPALLAVFSATLAEQSILATSHTP
jgi:hypothetical protein